MSDNPNILWEISHAIEEARGAIPREQVVHRVVLGPGQYQRLLDDHPSEPPPNLRSAVDGKYKLVSVLGAEILVVPWFDGILPLPEPGPILMRSLLADEMKKQVNKAIDNFEKGR